MTEVEDINTASEIEQDTTRFDAGTVAVAELAKHFDLYDPVHSERLWEVIAYARSACPVMRTDADTGYYVITNYEDVRRITEDPQTFSSVEAGLRGTPIRMPPLTEDPPTHAEYRRQLNRYLSRSYLARYEDDIRQTTREVLDEVVPRGRMEFMSEFAVPLTSANLARVILDEKNKKRIQRAINIATRISSEGSLEAFFEIAALADEFLRERAAAKTNREDVLSAIVHGTVEGRPLTSEEQVGATTVLFTGGLDTTKAAMGNIVRHIALNPELEARVRNPEWMRGDLDEFLRFDSPIMFMARTVTRETELSGCPLKPGHRVAIHFAAANRDPAQFENPDELNFDRRRNPHVAFGLGAHRCIGLHFARLQIQIAFEELFARVTSLRIPEGERVEIATGVVLSPERLPLEFDILNR
jgi:cytochrome P450